MSMALQRASAASLCQRVRPSDLRMSFSLRCLEHSTNKHKPFPSIPSHLFRCRDSCDSVVRFALLLSLLLPAPRPLLVAIPQPPQ